MNTVFMRVFQVLLCGLVIGAAVAHSALTEWPAVAPGTPEEAGFTASLRLQPPANRLFSPEEVLAAGRAAGDADTHGGAPYVTLFSNDTTVFNRDGYYHLVQQEAIKILTRLGVAEKSTIRLNYDIPYDRTRVLEAFAVHADGSVVKLTPGQIRDVPNSEDMEANIYEPIWRSLVLSYPGVAPGTVLYWAYEHVSVKPRNPGSFQWGHTFRSTVPMRSARIDLKGPVDLPIHWIVSNNNSGLVSFSCADAGEDRVYSWQSKPAEMIGVEPGMVPVEEMMTSLYVSTDTWREFSAGEARYIEPNLVPDEAIRSAVNELVADLDSPEAKLRALFNYVTKRVRYMGVAYGDRPGVNPDPVTRTFANNAGVCKDKAGLLTAMLRLAGIEACYALNNPERRIVQDVAVDQFNHAVVAARLPGESAWRTLDVTSDLSRSMCPAYSGGTQILRITPEGAEPETIPVSPPEANAGRFNARSRITPEGDLISSVHFTGDGAADQMYREAFYYTERPLWRDLFSYMVQSEFNRGELVSWRFFPEDPGDLDEPVSWQLDYRVPGYVTTAGSYRLLRLPLAQAPFNWFFEEIEEICSMEQRIYPADLVQTSSMMSEEILTLPDTMTPVAFPDPVRIEVPGLRYEAVINREDGGLRLSHLIAVTRSRISAEDYREFRKAFHDIRRSGRAWVILEVQP